MCKLFRYLSQMIKQFKNINNKEIISNEDLEECFS